MLYKRPKIKVPRFEEAQGFFTTAKRSSNMRKIKGKNTKPEIRLRQALWHAGFRFRISNKQIAGKPDLVFVRKKVAIFVDGEFWHGYHWREKKAKLQTNRRFWVAKIERNMQRDQEVNRQLVEEGWAVMRFWANEVNKHTENCLQKIVHVLSQR